MVAPRTAESSLARGAGRGLMVTIRSWLRQGFQSVTAQVLSTRRVQRQETRIGLLPGQAGKERETLKSPESFANGSFNLHLKGNLNQLQHSEFGQNSKLWFILNCKRKASPAKGRATCARLNHVPRTNQDQNPLNRYVLQAMPRDVLHGTEWVQGSPS